MSTNIGEKISVCLLTYNHIEVIESTLRTILDQTITGYEVIVSDDCSNDGTWERILELAAADAGAGVAGGAGDGPAAQRAVDVDGTAGEDLRAGGDRPHHGDVAGGVDDGLARADRPLDGEGGRGRLRGRLRRFRLRLDRDLDRAQGPPLDEERRAPRSEEGQGGTLDAEDAQLAGRQLGDEAFQLGRRGHEARDVEDHGLVIEQRARALQGAVQEDEPIGERSLGRERDGADIGSP